MTPFPIICSDCQRKKTTYNSCLIEVEMIIRITILKNESTENYCQKITALLLQKCAHRTYNEQEIMTNGYK